MPKIINKSVIRKRKGLEGNVYIKRDLKDTSNEKKNGQDKL